LDREISVQLAEQADEGGPGRNDRSLVSAISFNAIPRGRQGIL
jgi:hypothetical protein